MYFAQNVLNMDKLNLLRSHLTQTLEYLGLNQRLYFYQLWIQLLIGCVDINLNY